MRAFVISVNGKKICSVDLTPYNTREVELFWIGSTREREMIFLRVGGMDGDYHVNWSAPDLKVGDEVTVKIAEESDTDPPTSRKSVEEMDERSRALGRAKELP